jgi:hypothetical protein
MATCVAANLKNPDSENKTLEALNVIWGLYLAICSHDGWEG